jgi:hypothetical protein
LARDQKGDRLERIIGQRLAAGRIAGDAQCPDASIIAAYRERLLPGDERADCERHFAQCARCANALAALARIDEAVEPGGAASAQAAAGDNRGWWRLRGPLPLAAFGAAAAILIVVAIRTFSAQRGPIGGEARSELQAKSLAGNVAPTAAKPGTGALGGSNSLMVMNEPERVKPVSPPLPKSFAASQRRSPAEAGSESREKARSSSRDELAEKNTRALELEKQSAEVAAAPAVSAFSTASPAAAAPAAGATIGAGAAVSGRGRSALSDTAAAGVATMPGANAIVVEPPDHTATVVWMVGAHGAISRYSPATGWIPQTSGVTTDLTRGSAPSTTTCWVVGHGGTILRTVDGEHWTIVIAPVSDDLADVVASSATDATISAASGRRFSTSDGGATWRPL